MASLEDSYQLRKLASSIGSLLSGKYSDFKIRCSDGTVINAHRAVVCPRSRVLSATIDGTFQEAIANEVFLEDDEPDIVKRMVEFLYTADYNDRRSATMGDLDQKVDDLVSTVPDPPEEVIIVDDFAMEALLKPTDKSLEYNPQSLILNAQMYIIADKNEIKALKRLASLKYKQVASKCWNDHAFSESARLIYENTVESDRTIKDVIVQVASDNISALLDRGEFTELLNIYGELSTSILKCMVAGKPAYSRGKKMKSNY